MNKRLNIPDANAAMEAKGLSQALIAEHLDVSREAVSQWLKEKAFPRPNKLLQLAKLLGLSFSELVISEEENAPVVAFRKRKGTKTTSQHISKAQETGRFLRHLVPYLPFDLLVTPPVLKSPSSDYDYLCKVTEKVRKDIKLSATETVDFPHLIRHFRDLQTVIVPALWGSEGKHENAVHIYLPDSQTTWVYLNLDVNTHDFKFWMAHELGHCLSPSLSGDKAEDFADDFAGALLFPKVLAEQSYAEISKQLTPEAKIAKVLEIADLHIISPRTVIGQVNKFATYTGVDQLSLSGDFDKAVASFNEKYPNLSTTLLGEISALDASDFIAKTSRNFETPFFNVLGQYLKENNKGAGFVQTVTDMSLLDARSIHSELT